MNNTSFLKKYQYSYILGVCILVFVLMGMLTYYAVSGMLINSSKSNAMGLAVIAANEIDGDVFDTIRSEDDIAYQEVFDLLYKYKDYNMLQYIYTMRYENGVVTFVVDADDDEPALCGEQYGILEDMLPAFNGEVCCDQVMYRDKWGDFYSAYAPIRNSAGSVVGIVGCDINTADIKDRLLRLRVMLIALLGIFTIISLIYISLYSINIINVDPTTRLRTKEGFIRIGNVLKKKGILKDYSLIQMEIKNYDYALLEAGCTEEELIDAFSKYLKSVQPMKGHVAKISTEVFLMLVGKEDEKAALEKLTPAPITVGEGKTNVYFNIGICRASENDSLADLIRSCSITMDEARENNREDYVIYDEEIRRTHKLEKTIEAKFPDALAKDEFCVFYQPKVDLRNNTLCGAEALVRWKKDGEIISPVRFIGILEKMGLITRLDFYVFETVCQNLRRWLDEGLPAVTVSSNFSKMHLKNPNLADDVLRIVKKYDIDPGLVEIELTESSGYSDFEALKHFVDEMENVGIHTSIDDFGTGYSSLSLLKEVNVDVVKLDKTFCDHLGEDDIQTGLTVNVIHMIKDLDRVVLCEGVETGEQAEILRKTDCTIVQGYYYDKPLPMEKFEERMKNPKYEG